MGELQQVHSLSMRDGLSATANSELAVNVAGMFLDGVYTNDQLVSDFRVRVTFADQAHDFQFARRERIKLLSRPGPGRFSKCVCARRSGMRPAGNQGRGRAPWACRGGLSSRAAAARFLGQRPASARCSLPVRPTPTPREGQSGQSHAPPTRPEPVLAAPAGGSTRHSFEQRGHGRALVQRCECFLVAFLGT